MKEGETGREERKKEDGQSARPRRKSKVRKEERQ
jgi:hypothetical protein